MCIRMYGAVRPRPQVLTVPVLSAGYLQTAVSITCHEPQHRAFITSVRLCRRQMQRRGILSFLQVHTIRAYQSAMWGFTAETGS